MPIYVHINEAGALRNQRYAFTDRFTLVSELLQNARRAGATRVEVSYDEDTQTLCVRDDGAGIDDFQALLSIYASGWPTALCMEEQAFGVGFSQCLYLARQCRVASKGQVIDFDCAAALAQQPIAVLESAEFIDGTWVTLYGVELPDWQARIERLCVGFAVEVGLNHQPLPRPLALTQLQTQTTPLGQVYLLSRDDGWSSTDLMVFLQGFCVWRSPYCRINQANVIHLDPRQFLARLPDRDKLLDEELQLPHIKATLQQCWQQVLHEQLQHLGETLFLQRYYHSVQCWEQWPLLNALTVLPAALCQRIDDYPQQSEPGLEGYLQPCSRPFDRQAIEQGAVQLVALNPLDEQNAALWMFARAMGFVLCDPARLDPQHWVHPMCGCWMRSRFGSAPSVSSSVPTSTVAGSARRWCCAKWCGSRSPRPVSTWWMKRCAIRGCCISRTTRGPGRWCARLRVTSMSTSAITATLLMRTNTPWRN